MDGRGTIRVPVETKGVADAEGVEPDKLERLVRDGRVVIPFNQRHRDVQAKAIGEGMSVKVNANIGTSREVADLAQELEKARVAARFGADAVMDLSTGGEIPAIRRAILDACTLPLGTVPIYEAMCHATEKGDPLAMTADDLFRTIESHARDGVDFMTVHCGVTRKTAETLSRSDRTTGVVSRGGAMLVAWMRENDRENPLYEDFDHLLDLANEHGFALSLGDGLRPGSISDATDAPQIDELIVLGGLVERARKAGVQTMVEGPGHVPIDQIESNVRLEKTICRGAPFYVLGPLVCDVAAGYDHIAGAIGGAMAAYYGADFLCYVTPSEHLSLPSVDDVREGVVASRIAAHAADVARGRGRDWDRKMSAARKAFDWEEMYALSFDPERARKYKERGGSMETQACTMCGELCAMKMVERTHKRQRPSE
jgi:phosphomethylpyrimidine synthase